MRRVLFIAYHYPPTRGGERSQRFVRYLPAFGYAPVVLTTSAFGGRGVASAAGDVIRVPEIMGGFRWLFNRRQRRAAEAIRSQVRTTGAWAGVLSRFLQRWVFMPDAQAGWLPWAFPAGVRVLRGGAEILYSSYPPGSAHVLGMLLKGATGRPWIADFRDAWTFDPLDERLNIGGMRLNLERALEGMVLRRADRVIVTTEVVRRDFAERYPEQRGKLVVIPNGFDGDEIERASTVPRLPEDRLWVVHTGSFGYSHPNRSPFSLFGALRRLLEERPEVARRLRLMLIGSLTEGEQKGATDLAAKGMVEIVGPVSRDTALGYQKAADVLLLVDHPREGPASNVPRKFYEYLAMRKPILALVSEGATRDLLRELRAGIAVHPEDGTGIMEAFTLLVKRSEEGMLRSEVRDGMLARFEARTLAGALVVCLDGARRAVALHG